MIILIAMLALDNSPGMLEHVLIAKAVMKDARFVMKMEIVKYAKQITSYLEQLALIVDRKSLVAKLVKMDQLV